MNPLAVPVLRGLREVMLTEAQQSAAAWSLCRRRALRAATARGQLARGLLALGLALRLLARALALGPLALVRGLPAPVRGLLALRLLAPARGLKCRKAWGSCPHPGGG